MPIVITCPACQKQLRVPDHLLGQKVRCPSCREAFVGMDQARETSLAPLAADGEKPGKVQAIAIMMLVGGILALLGSLSWIAYFGLMGVATLGLGLVCCLWPGPYYGLTMGIMAVIKGSQLLGEKAHMQRPPKGIAIMQIVNIVNLDVPNCVMGIVGLVFLNSPEVRRYFRPDRHP